MHIANYLFAILFALSAAANAQVGIDETSPENANRKANSISANIVVEVQLSEDHEMKNTKMLPVGTPVGTEINDEDDKDIISTEHCVNCGPPPTPDPTMSPTTKAPTTTPTPQPTTCAEDPHAIFFFKFNEKGKPVFRECEWLQQKEDSIDRICRKKTESCQKDNKIIGPPKEVCMNTCDTCYLMNPSETPTTAPSSEPTKKPTGHPTHAPTMSPTDQPSKGPTDSPSHIPTTTPTKEPTKNPTKTPTNLPTLEPTSSPTALPTNTPTSEPSNAPSKEPTDKPTKSPTRSPTMTPSDKPTSMPSPAPTLQLSMLPSSEPSGVPSLSPTTCAEDASALFFLKYRDGAPVYKTCQWLKQDTNTQGICVGKIDSCPETNIGPAREVCMNTCDTCFLMHPSASPSYEPTEHPTLLPTKEPSNVPTISPTPKDCDQDSHAVFFFKYEKNGTPVFRTCDWLRKRDDFREICQNTNSIIHGNAIIGPARELCMNTCGTCYLMHPSQTPSHAPSKNPSSHPSQFPTRYPTLHPSKNPTRAPIRPTRPIGPSKGGKGKGKGGKKHSIHSFGLNWSTRAPAASTRAPSVYASTRAPSDSSFDSSMPSKNPAVLRAAGRRLAKRKRMVKRADNHLTTAIEIKAPKSSKSSTKGPTRSKSPPSLED